MCVAMSFNTAAAAVGWRLLEPSRQTTWEGKAPVWSKSRAAQRGAVEKKFLDKVCGYTRRCTKHSAHDCMCECRSIPLTARWRQA